MYNEPEIFADRIHIEQLEIFARDGVPEKERASAQRLTVNNTFWPRQQTGCGSSAALQRIGLIRLAALSVRHRGIDCACHCSWASRNFNRRRTEKDRQWLARDRGRDQIRLRRCLISTLRTFSTFAVRR